jgi:hypothetical protein
MIVDEFFYCYEPSQILASPGFWTFKNRDRDTKIIQGLRSSNHEWKDATSSFMVIIGKGFPIRRWTRISSEFVGLGVLLRHPVCVCVCCFSLCSPRPFFFFFTDFFI